MSNLPKGSVPDFDNSPKGSVSGMGDRIVRRPATTFARAGARVRAFPRSVRRLVWVAGAVFEVGLLSAQAPFSPAAAGPHGSTSNIVEALLGATDSGSRSARVDEVQARLTPQVAAALRREAGLRIERGDLAGAQAAAETALTVGVRLQDASAQGEGHLAWGLVLAQRADHARARTRYDEALRLAASAKDTDLELEVRTQLGRSWLHAGDFDRALAEFGRCLEVGEATRDQAAEAAALRNLGETMRQHGQLQDALKYLEAALERAPGGTNVAATADTRLSLASVLIDLGEAERALREYEAVLAHYRAVKDIEGQGIVLGNMGVAWEMTARYAVALRHYEESFELKGQVGDLPGRVFTLNNLGVLWLMAGDYEDALDYFQQSLELAEQTGDFSGKVRALNNRGETLVQMGRYLEGFRALDESLKLYAEAGDPVSAAEVRGGIAALKKALGDHRGALADFRAILPVFEADGRKPLVAMTLHNLGGLQQLLGRSREATGLLEASLALRRELGDRQGEAVTQNALGEVALGAGDPEAARAHHAQALGIARDIGARIEEVRALVGRGVVVLRLGRPPEAMRWFREADDTAAPLTDAGLRIEAWKRLGDAHRAQTNWADAVAAYRRAVGRIEGLRFEVSGASHRVGFLEQYAPAYQGLAASLVRLGRVAEAWQAAEACQARTLAEALYGQGSASPEGLTAEERKRWRELEGRVRLARLEQSMLESQAPVEPGRLKEVAGRLGPAIEALEGFEKELQLRHPPAAPPRSLAFDSAQRLDGFLGWDQPVVFLEYFVGEESTLLFVLSSPSDEPVVFELDVSSKDLAALVRNLRNRLENRWLSLPLPESRRLYDLLIAPARERLAGRACVCIVPDGVLWEVPFQALCDASRRYLIQDHAVAYAPSLRALAALRERERQRRGGGRAGDAREWNVLVMANPDLGTVGQVANPLLGAPVAIPGTEEQGRRIAQMFGERSRLCVGAEATEQRARELAPHYRVLHFATHGIFAPGSPMFSGIRLARGDGDDGYWEAREILLTGLNAELVVLSACETARGQLRQGEGIWGLSWALLTAGSPANVLSQWAVADQSTAELMTAFYRHWRGAGGGETDAAGGGARVSKAEALRRAQLELLEGRSAGGRKHAHPFHWAPFILIGEPE